MDGENEDDRKLCPMWMSNCENCPNKDECDIDRCHWTEP